MSKQATDVECKLCDTSDGLTFAVVTEEPLSEDSSIEADPIVLCDTHYTKLVENTDYHVRELAPVSEERGGFTRTTDGEGKQILYDHEISEDSWVRFDPDSDEIDLTE